MEQNSQALASLTVNANIGMDEVVSVFVSRYEDQLFERKDLLSEQIRLLKKQLSDLDKDILRAVNLDQFNISIPVLNMTGKVDKNGPSVNWTGSYNYAAKSIGVCIIMEMTQEGGGNREHQANHYYHNIPISEEDVKRKEKIDADIANLSTELVEVMNQIKSVGRKERQIRGKISELKLAESGHLELLNNPELLKLTSLT